MEEEEEPEMKLMTDKKGTCGVYACARVCVCVYTKQF